MLELKYPASWNKLIAGLPDAHLLQTLEWGRVKAQFGWQPRYFIWAETTSPSSQVAPPSDQVKAAAQVLVRTIPAGGFAARMRVMYVPKGPILDWNDIELRHKVWDDLQLLARRSGAIFIKIDPDIRLGIGISQTPGSIADPSGQSIQAELEARGWRYSGEQIQFRNTVMVDLSIDEGVLLARMKPKSRYNIRLAERKGVLVRTGYPSDYDMLYRMYAETSVRDGFVIRNRDYYQAVWRCFPAVSEPPNSTLPVIDPLIAEVAGEPIAAIIVFRFANRAWYIYGMSRTLHRDKMPNHLLQWEAIRRAKAAGCRVYDLWGAPETFSESDPLWGVYKFKEGLGGQVIRHIGAWDLPTNPLLYRLYTQMLPRLLDILRNRGKSRTRQMLSM